MTTLSQTEIERNGVFEAQDKGGLPFRILMPESTESTWALILFLHGAGERGTDNELQLVNAIHTMAGPSVMEDFPALVVAPQCPLEQKWANVDWSLPSHQLPTQASAPMQAAMQIVDALCDEHPIDRNRLYLIGLSMGGYGTWDALARYPQRFAAAIPICGGADEATAPAIAHIPIWAFHGDQDDAVPVSRSRNMVEALRNAGGTPRYTEFKDVGHNSWDPAFEDPGLLPWLFAQHR